MVVLVPRQIQMAGMTGQVPYYGGRFTPAQAYAASHRRPAPPPPAPPPRAPRGDVVDKLDALLEEGVITREEYADLRARAES
jgi:hypothetical protein